MKLSSVKSIENQPRHDLKILGVVIITLFLFTFNNPINAQQLIVVAERFNEKELKSKFEDFVNKIDSASLTRKYPEISKKILSNQADQQEVALRMLGESQEIIAIPWILLLLDSDDQDVKIEAGLAINNIVSSISLKRRDRRFPQYFLLKQPTERDINLKPLAWVSLKLLRANEPNLIAYGLTITRYLNLYEFEAEILSHKESVHPAVTNTLDWVAKELELQKKYDAGELKAGK